MAVVLQKWHKIYDINGRVNYMNVSSVNCLEKIPIGFNAFDIGFEVFISR